MSPPDCFSKKKKKKKRIPLAQNQLQPYRLYGLKKNMYLGKHKGIFGIYYLTLPTHTHNYVIKSVMVHT